ncbi:hypothetical protein GCM10027436_55730 [Actinophytocola sediminis]
MNDRGPWAVTCRDVAGRPRSLTVLVHGSDIVVVAPPVEVVRRDAAETEQFRFATTVEVAATPAPSGPGPSEEIGTASTVRQYRDGVPPAVAGRPASPSCRGGTTAPVTGSAATPTMSYVGRRWRQPKQPI